MMHHIHTHYDNLQLTQSATHDEIRQAYRRLSKKYHPDLSDDPDAHRIMQIVNRAYEILSDPQSRAEHDKWIALQYLQQQQTFINPQSITYYDDDPQPNHSTAPTQPSRQPHYSTHHASTHQHSHKKILMGLLGISAVLLGLIVWQGWGWLERSQLLSLMMGTTPVYQQNTVADNAEFPTISSQTDGNENYIRPQTAPNGQPFPQTSDYVDGYPVIAGMANGKLVIENVRNSSDVFAQLYEKNSSQPIRTFFILERDQIHLNQLDAGDYFVRYYQLDNGEYLNSEIISLVRNQSATIYLLRGKAPI